MNIESTKTGRLELCFSFLFFSEIGRPLELAGISSEAESALLAFFCTEPKDCSVILDEHHSCPCRELITAKGTFS